MSDYLRPLNDWKFEIITSGLPYLHHRGLWLGCEPLEGEDYWGDTPLSRGQIRSIDLQLHEVELCHMGDRQSNISPIPSYPI